MRFSLDAVALCARLILIRTLAGLCLAGLLLPGPLIAQDVDANQATDGQQDLVKLLSNQAWENLEKGLVPLARESFEAILEEAPNFVDARVGLAVVLYSQEKYRDGLDELERAWDQDPENARLQQWRDRLFGDLLGRDQDELAREYLNRAIDRHPRDPWPSFWLGRQELGDGRLASAAVLLENVVTLDPNWPDVHIWLGSAYQQSDLNVTALRVFSWANPASEDSRGSLLVQEAVAAASLGMRGWAYQNLNAALATSQSQNASRVIGQLDQAVAENRWTGYLRYGQRYDENPAVLPDVNVFGVTGLVPRPTGGSVVGGRLARTLFGDSDFDLTAGGTYYQTLNYRLDDADVIDAAADLTFNYRWFDSRGVVWQAGISTNYDYYWFGRNGLVSRLGTTTSLAARTDDFTNWTLYGRYLINDFINQGVSNGTPRDLDSQNMGTGLVWSRELPGTPLTTQFGYHLDFHNADGADFDYTGHRAGGGLVWQMQPDGIELGAHGYIYFRSYENVDSIFSGPARRRGVLDDGISQSPDLCRPRFALSIQPRSQRLDVAHQRLSSQYLGSYSAVGFLATRQPTIGRSDESETVRNPRLGRRPQV